MERQLIAIVVRPSPRIGGMPHALVFPCRPRNAIWVLARLLSHPMLSPAVACTMSKTNRAREYCVLQGSANALEIEVEYMTEPGIEGVPTTVRPQPPLISNYGLVVTVYILYLFGFLTAITALVGVIIAYLQQNNTDPVCRSHFRFQVRTFWIGLVFLVVGLLMIHIVIGAFILLWWIIWTLMRCVKGLLALNTGEPIPNPNSWWLGER
jgi:uncharacterized membrane protein